MTPEITIDTSVPMAVILNEPTRDSLLALTQGTILLSPAILPWEIGNALSALLMRQLLDLQQVNDTLALFNEIPIRLIPGEIRSALAIAARWNLYAYDAYVIECAKFSQTPLLSLDRRQCEAARNEGVVVLEVPQ